MKNSIVLFFIACLFYSCNKLIEFVPGGGHSSSEFKKVYGGTDQDAIGDVLITGDGGYFLQEVLIAIADHLAAADHSGVVGTAKK